MALGYTSSSPLTYQAFLETSFGYGTTELQNLPNSPFTSPTDYVKIIITASLHWDDNGHIGTPEVGTAIPVYNKENATWFVEGERDDVNAVLNQLKFYPTTHQDTLDWSPDVTRPNSTSGTYFNDTPPTIPTTYMSMSIYQTSGLFVSYDIYIEATPLTYNNSRPYFSAYGTGFDLASAAYDTDTGSTINLGTVEDGGDGDNLEVKCEFLRVDGTEYTGTAYGEFVGHAEMYIGDKKPLVPNTTDKRFSFIGNKTECQAFLDNVTYKGNDYQSSFKMKFTVSDGVLGSYYEKLYYHSDLLVAHSAIANQSFVEDTQALWDLGIISFNNLDKMSEVDTFSVTITLSDTSCASQFYTTTTVDTQSFTNGVLTITDTDINTLNSAISTLVFMPERDFDSAFTFTTRFTFSSSTYQTTYYSADSISNVEAHAVTEMIHANRTHTPSEDVPYTFSPLYPRIVHPFNDNFELTLTLSNPNAGNLWVGYPGDSNTLTGLGNGVYRLTGDKNTVNTSLQYLYVYHNSTSADNETDYTISLSLDRTSGNQTYDPIETGTLTMNVNASSEFTMPVTLLEYNEDEQTDFDLGVNITDPIGLYAQNSGLYGTEYRVEITLLNIDNSAFTDGTVDSTNTSALSSFGGNGASATPLFLEGPASDVETALANIRFHPNVDTNGDLKFSVALKRVADNKLIDTQTRLINGIPVDEYQNTSTSFDWTEETTLEGFDTLIRIIDAATENSDYTHFGGWYQVDFRLKDANNNVYSPYDFYSLSLDSLDSYVVDNVAGTFRMIGTKSAINANLANMRFTPRLDTTEQFTAEFRIERLHDNVVFVDYTDSLTFNTGSNTSEWQPITLTNHQLVEDTITNFDASFTITDTMTDNSNYSSAITTSTYTVKARLRYTDNANLEQDLPDVYLGLSGSYETHGLTNITGNGSTASPLEFTGSKFNLNNALSANQWGLPNRLEIWGDIDVLGSANTSGEFYVEFEVVRNYDSSSVDFPTFANGLHRRLVTNAVKDTSEFDTVAEYTSTKSMYANTWTQFATPNRLGLEITDTSDNTESKFPTRNTTYTVEIRGWNTQYAEVIGGTNTVGEELKIWALTTSNVTGQSTNHLTFSGTKAECNTILQTIRVATSVDTWDATNSQLQFKVSRTTYGTDTIVLPNGDWGDIVIGLLIDENRIVLDMPTYREDRSSILTPITLNEGIAKSIPFGYTGPDYPYSSYANTSYDVVITFPNVNGNRTVERIHTYVSDSVVKTQYLNANNDYIVEFTADADSLESWVNRRVIPYRDFTDTISATITFTRTHDSVVYSQSDTSVNVETHDEYYDHLDQNNITEDSVDSVLFPSPYRSIYINGVRQYLITDLAPDDGGDSYPTEGLTYEVSVEAVQTDTLDALYFNDHYFAEDYASFETYVLNSKLEFSGTKSQINQWAQGLTYTTLSGKPGRGATNIMYTQKRYKDGVYDVTHADNVELFTIGTPQAAPDFETGGQVNSFNFSNDWEWETQPSGPDVKITQYYGGFAAQYDQFNNYHTRITDTYTQFGVEPLYRATFELLNSPTGTTTYYDHNRNLLTFGTTDWMSKSDLNIILEHTRTVINDAVDSIDVRLTVERDTLTEEPEELYSVTQNNQTIDRPDFTHTMDHGLSSPVTLGVNDTFSFHHQNWRNSDYSFPDNYIYKGIITPSAPSGINFYGTDCDLNADGSTDILNGTKFDFVASANTWGEDGQYAKLKQNYNMTFYAHALGSVFTAPDYAHAGLITDHYLPKPIGFSNNIIHAAEMNECTSLNDEDLRIVVDTPIILFTNPAVSTITLDISCTTYDDITSANPVLQDSVTSSLQINANNLRPGDCRVSDIVSKSDGVYFTVYITNSTYQNNNRIVKLGLFKLTYVSGNLTITKLTEKQTITSGTTLARVMANVSDDADKLIVMSSIDDTQALQVYYKDEGGTDNWGLKASDSISTSDQYVNFYDGYNWDTLPSSDYELNTNVCHSFYNGTNTIVTMSGRVYKKDEGGTDNWGYVKTVSAANTTTENYSGFTSDYFFVVYGGYIDLYDNEDINLITNIYQNPNVISVGQTSGVTEPDNTSFAVGNIVSGPIIQNIHFGKSSNILYVETRAYVTSYGSSSGYAARYYSINLAPK